MIKRIVLFLCLLITTASFASSGSDRDWSNGAWQVCWDIASESALQVGADIVQAGNAAGEYVARNPWQVNLWLAENFPAHPLYGFFIFQRMQSNARRGEAIRETMDWMRDNAHLLDEGILNIASYIYEQVEGFASASWDRKREVICDVWIGEILLPTLATLPIGPALGIASRGGSAVVNGVKITSRFVSQVRSGTVSLNAGETLSKINLRAVATYVDDAVRYITQGEMINSIKAFLARGGQTTLFRKKTTRFITKGDDGFQSMDEIPDDLLRELGLVDNVAGAADESPYAQWMANPDNMPFDIAVQRANGKLEYYPVSRSTRAKNYNSTNIATSEIPDETRALFGDSLDDVRYIEGVGKQNVEMIPARELDVDELSRLRSPANWGDDMSQEIKPTDWVVVEKDEFGEIVSVYKVEGENIRGLTSTPVNYEAVP